MNTNCMKKIKYQTSKEDIPVWKVFQICPIHGEHETPFFFKPITKIVGVTKRRIGIFAFLSEVSAQIFKRKLQTARGGAFDILKFRIPKAEKYRIGYLPAGCHSAGMKCIAANRLVHAKHNGEGNYEVMP